MPQIALYARVSSDKQAQEGTIETQIFSIKEYAQFHGYEIKGNLIFVDNGVSGSTLVRPGLDALRDRAVAGKIDKVIILNPDRLARRYAHQLVLIEEFQKLGVEVVFVNRQISESPEDQLLLQIQGVISEYEREKILERSRRGKLSKAKQGKISVLSGAPYGYVYIKVAEGDDAKYEVEEDEAKIVRQIFQMYVQQQMTIGAIARHLTSEAIPSQKSAGHWERSVIWAILRNPAYMGKAAYRKTMCVERQRPSKQAYDHGYYPKHAKSSTRDRPKEDRISIDVPAIVSEAMFNQAQEQLERNKKLSPRNNKKNEYLLGGLLRCKECGYSLYGNPRTKPSPFRDYRCLGQDGYRWPNGRKCSGHPVRVDVLDELVWEQIRRLLEQPELVFEEYNKRQNKKKQGKLTYEQVTTEKKKQIRRYESEKQRLLDLYQRGTISVDEIENRLNTIERASVNYGNFR